MPLSATSSARSGRLEPVRDPAFIRRVEEAFGVYTAAMTYQQALRAMPAFLRGACAAARTGMPQRWQDCINERKLPQELLPVLSPTDLLPSADWL